MGDWVDQVLYEKDSELEEDWSMQLKESLSRIMNVLNDVDTRIVLHIEERDLASDGILDALNAIAAHNDIFEMFTREEIDGLVNNLRQLKGPLVSADQTVSQLQDNLRARVKEQLTMLIQLSPRS